MRRLPAGVVVLAFASVGMAWGTENESAGKQAATQEGAVVGEWGEKTGEFKVRLTVKAGAAKGGAFPVVAEIRNVSEGKVSEKRLKVWLMIAQGADRAYYTETVALGPRTLAAGATVSVPIKGGDLAAFRYGAGLELRDGVPVPSDLKAVKPKSVGKVSEVLPAGAVKMRAFFVVSQDIDAELKEKVKSQVISSATVSVQVLEKAES